MSKPKLKSKKLFDRVYEIVAKIPKGKVATYGQIAKIVGTRDSRKVGWALHANTDKVRPCHRVVNKNGKVATGYAFGGWEEQKGKLIAEGIVFKDEKNVDLEKFLWNPH